MVSNDRGRREVQFYVIEDNGGRDLAVVGKEKSARHMVYTIPAKFFHFLNRLSATSSSATEAMEALPSDLKLRSRRQVVDWLSLLVSDSTPYGLSPVFNKWSEDEDASLSSAIPVSKVLSSRKIRCDSEEFFWRGSAWDCKKRRKHYQSFSRNGIAVSVHDFVYVMAEDSKRLIAYIEDLFEDVRANKMVSVRWFHKIDEVSIVLPPNTIDREIFFSLCLQDLSVECIDGLAAVLGFEDFGKFQKEAQHMISSWDPYLCRRLIDVDECKPFDVTQVQGYWSQDLLRSLYPSCLKLRLNIKDHRKLYKNNGLLDVEGKVNGIRKPRNFSAENNRKVKQIFSQLNIMAPGSSIELLSQDSGIRGCWFCCVVLKKHHDKIKVRYHDVLDANETNNLEEWVSISKIAAPDKSGIRLCKRPIVRPSPLKNDTSLCSYEVGKIVDVWWHDGWWEGIVINNGTKGKLHVYFPGEQRASTFCQGDLRPSQEWFENKWNHMKERPDIASQLLLDQDREKCSDCITFQNVPFDAQTPSYNTPRELESTQEKGDSFSPCGRVDILFEKRDHNPLKSCILDGLKWCTSRKRKHRKQFGREYFGCKRRCVDASNQMKGNDNRHSNGTFLIPKSTVLVDQENWKSSHDPLLGSQPLTLCSKLVMTR